MNNFHFLNITTNPFFQDLSEPAVPAPLELGNNLVRDGFERRARQAEDNRSDGGGRRLLLGSRGLPRQRGHVHRLRQLIVEYELINKNSCFHVSHANLVVCLGNL